MGVPKAVLMFFFSLILVISMIALVQWRKICCMGNCLFFYATLPRLDPDSTKNIFMRLTDIKTWILQILLDKSEIIHFFLLYQILLNSVERNDKKRMVIKIKPMQSFVIYFSVCVHECVFIKERERERL